MKILVVGGGGREHAIIKKLRENPEIDKIYALPGNGGIAADAECVDIGAKEIGKIRDFAIRAEVDFAVVAPDNPLVLGAVDELENAGVPCFGPSAAAAQIEGSKAFAKDLMAKYGIPTASYKTFDNAADAMEWAKICPLPIVVKADGLALGKGVLICETRDDVTGAVESIMNDRIFGESGAKVVIEEFLCGPEVSVLAFCDGETVKPMVSSMDHKRALDNDKGLNTGGMGTVAPNPYYTKEVAQRCMDEIFVPTVRAMKAEGRPFKGCLYFGLMITADGPKVIEYNCRFGDPETQVVLPLMESDLYTVMRAVRDGKLDQCDVRFKDENACCVVLASDGYPVKYDKGFEIKCPDNTDAQVFVAGAALKDGKLVTSGGRVLGVTATADALEDAVAKAYAAADKIEFANKYCRRDIGKAALRANK